MVDLLSFYGIVVWDVLHWLECEMIGIAGIVVGMVECIGWKVW